jgi:integrase
MSRRQQKTNYQTTESNSQSASAGRLLQKKVTLPDGRRKSLYGRSKEELEEKARRELAVFDTTVFDVYYANVFVPYLVGKELEPSSVRKYAWALDRYFRPHFGMRHFKEITRQDLQSWFNNLQNLDGSKMAPGTKRLLRSKVSEVFNLAVVDEVIPANPVKYVRLPNVVEVAFDQPPPHVMRNLTWLNPPVGQACRLCLLGLRAAEATGATLADLVDGNLVIRQQRPKGGVKDRLKTPQSKRIIPLTPEIEAEIRAHSGEFYLVAGDDGQPKHPTYVGDELWFHLEAVGLPQMTLKSLRKWFSSVIENDLEAPRPVLQALIGHKGKEMADVYSKAAVERRRVWTERYWGHLTSTGVGQRGVLRIAKSGSE